MPRTTFALTFATAFALTCSALGGGAVAGPAGVAGAAAIAADDNDERMTVFRVPMLLVGNGESIENGMVAVRGGKIVAVGVDLPIPTGATLVEFEGGVLTPGLIDANTLLEPANLIAASRDWSRGGSRGATGGVSGGGGETADMSFAAGDPQSEMGAEAGAELGAQRSSRRGRFLAQLIMHNHTGDDCSVCDLFAVSDSCAFAAAHEDLEDDVSCPVCGYPGTLLDHLDGAVSGVRPGLVLSESSSEIVPHTFVIDSLNLRTPDLDRLLRGGVTTIFASPDTTSVIGPHGAILRTGGPVRNRVIDPAAAVTASISTDPFRGAVRNSPPRRGIVTFNSRRPNTRMGLTWVFRKAFHDAELARIGSPFGGADTPSDEAIAVLQRIRAGELPIRMHARQQNDIESAIRLGAEFDLSFTLIEASEAFKTIDSIRGAGVPVVFGPIWTEPSGPRVRMFDSRESRLSTLASLLDAGVTTALSAQDLRDEDGLRAQIQFAVRAGVDPAAALTATTLTPARLLGLDSRIGSIEVGKDADLVVWNAAPHEAGAAPVFVMIGGEILLSK